MLQITFISHLWERVFEHTVYCNSTYQQISEVYTYVQWYNDAVNDDTVPHGLKMCTAVLVTSLYYANLSLIFSSIKNGIPLFA